MQILLEGEYRYQFKRDESLKDDARNTLNVALDN